MVSDSAWQHQFIEANAIRLHYVTQGEGELVLLLHGFPEFWYSWRYQIPALAKHFKVVVPDLRGYNDSEKPKSGYDLDTLSTDVRSLIERLGYSRAHIVGHDWGGAIAWRLAQQFPNFIDRLALLSAPHPQRFAKDLLSNLDQLRRSWYVLAFQVPNLPEWLIQLNLREFVRNMFQEQAVRKGAFTQEQIQQYQAALQKPGALAAAVNSYRQLFLSGNWIDWMRSPDPISVPTLVLWGDEDSILSPKLMDGIEQWISAPFQFKLIPHCGHWIQQEAPQTVNRELLQFLRSPALA
ncbi:MULTISPECIES: alpha/beta fold hydrolase [Leptolyngbya]|jgi:pimeloyl-ACP methyl ester carboxylesterase|uniref:Alpha/beta hydrolase fold protein n=2 Tax=Leptolyngbya boryana TaxID=1184 RepID=A0A1Z4JFQ3_LEPBY|nr:MULTISPECIES: alpha/beta hydrolase [Leptolyngbya]BAY55498.1 alpha/beta hydrolase fold protein [Leptolyngbya boryana NIES-2135]MBD1854332.1 alpha/beta hydrolase [Leptolyngbya sp. FACHB-1624]MBD2368350.1 alpha/beta hydrolase [Leptolyngbya sp. FACHB-161]MBD2374994.1 alpha/beta hydrolase [Leptolyngbya sp. FACHB-238]MBD2399414.1 alpha/beta hydrolase [Leptolyngbya sp. FACHB-239]